MASQYCVFVEAMCRVHCAGSFRNYRRLRWVIPLGSPVTAYVGLRVEKRLVTPLVTVTEAARSIAAGDFGRRASGQGGFGEAGRLIEYFNRMAE